MYTYYDGKLKKALDGDEFIKRVAYTFQSPVRKIASLGRQLLVVASYAGIEVSYFYGKFTIEENFAFQRATYEKAKELIGVCGGGKLKVSADDKEAELPKPLAVSPIWEEFEEKEVERMKNWCESMSKSANLKGTDAQEIFLRFADFQMAKVRFCIAKEPFEAKLGNLFLAADIDSIFRSHVPSLVERLNQAELRYHMDEFARFEEERGYLMPRKEHFEEFAEEYPERTDGVQWLFSKGTVH